MFEEYSPLPPLRRAAKSLADVMIPDFVSRAARRHQERTKIQPTATTDTTQDATLPSIDPNSALLRGEVPKITAGLNLPDTPVPPLHSGGPVAGASIQEFTPGTTSRGYITRGPKGEFLLTNIEGAGPEISERLPEVGQRLQDPNMGTTVVKTGGRGAFSPSRGIPELTRSFEEISKTESPLVQRMWMENVLKSNEVDRNRADLRDINAKAMMAEAQAELFKEQASRLGRDAEQVAYEESLFPLRDFIKRPENWDQKGYGALVLAKAEQIAMERYGIKNPAQLKTPQGMRIVDSLQDAALDQVIRENLPRIQEAQARGGYLQ